MQLSELNEKTFYTRMIPDVNGEMFTLFGCYYSIYSLVNTENGKRYIGRTQNPKSRIRTHLCQLKTGNHPNELLNQDSGQHFDFVILKDGILDSDEAKRMERFYMVRFKTYDPQFGYNGNDRMLQRFIKNEEQ